VLAVELEEGFGPPRFLSDLARDVGLQMQGTPLVVDAEQACRTWRCYCCC
jgi:hypothetical protein